MKLIEFFAGYPRIAAGVVLAAALVALPILGQLQIDNSIEVWIDQESDAYRTYQDFLREFGSEEFLLIIYDAPAEIDDDFLFDLTDLRFDLEEVDGVRLAIDLSSLRGKLSSSSAADFAAEVASSPFYRGFLVSEDGGYLATWLLLDLESSATRITIVEAVEGVLAARWPGREVRLAGTPAISAALDRTSRRAAQTLFPFVFLASGAMLIFRYRRPLKVAVPLISVGAGIALTLALLERFGGALDMVTSALPSVLWILGLSTSIHLLSSRRRQLAAGATEQAATLGAMREVARPCFFSALTTSLGFLALTSSAMQPVRTIGLFSAVGVLICFATNFALFPALAGLAGGASTKPASRSWPIRLGRFAVSRPVPTVGAAVLLTVLLVLAVSRVRAESNVVSFLKPDTPIATTYRDVLPRLTGPFSLELLVNPPGQLANLERFRELDRIETAVGSVDGIAKTLSPVGLVKKTHRFTSGAAPDVWELPPTEDDFSLTWDRTGASLADELGMLYDDESGSVRISLLARPMGSEAHRLLVEELRERVASSVDPSWRPRLTGIVDLLVEMHTELVRSQVRSFLLAFILIGPVIALLLRSPRYALLSLPANLLPILVALGAMGALDIPLDPATVMIAAMALGIAVDDTIHFLTRYRIERAKSEIGSALERTFEVVANPIADTSIIAAAGFLVLSLSEFVPLIYFGLLTALTLMAALVADLVVLPAVLVLVDRRQR